MKFKKYLTIALSAVMVTAALTGCSSSSDKSSTDDKGSVYYLSFKPEQEDQWKKVAKTYEEETGVKVKIVTAASGKYEETLKSEIAKDDAPTLFQINGPIGYQNWKEYTADLKDTELYKHLLNQDLAITEGDGVYGIPYVEEGYGIIYNEAIMNKYFKLDGAKAKSIDEINNFDKLKEVAEDMQSKKDQLGIDGVFASTSLTPGEDWRWQTHLANLPIYYEYKDKDVKDLDKIDFEDKNVYNMIGEGKTAGVFQLESPGMTSFMKELKPDCLEDIIAGISLYRPGPMAEIPRYIEGKRNKDSVHYETPELESILDVTYGVMVYQGAKRSTNTKTIEM